MKSTRLVVSDWNDVFYTPHGFHLTNQTDVQYELFLDGEVWSLSLQSCSPSKINAFFCLWRTWRRTVKRALRFRGNCHWKRNIARDGEVSKSNQQFVWLGKNSAVERHLRIRFFAFALFRSLLLDWSVEQSSSSYRSEKTSTKIACLHAVSSLHYPLFFWLKFHVDIACHNGNRELIERDREGWEELAITFVAQKSN